MSGDDDKQKRTSSSRVVELQTCCEPPVCLETVQSRDTGQLEGALTRPSSQHIVNTEFYGPSQSHSNLRTRRCVSFANLLMKRRRSRHNDPISDPRKDWLVGTNRAVH